MKENLNDLRAFLVVARTGSFTKAGAQMGVSQSALSHSIRGIEERLNIKLFHRTTRSISTTEAGEQLYQRLSPLFDDIDNELNELSEFRNAVTGTLRINGNEHAFYYALGDKFVRFSQKYPEVNLELVAENRFIDIVAERFDAGIRLGSDVAKDMIAVRLTDKLQMCCVASPEYLAKNGTPKTPYDLTEHQCLLHRLSNGGVMNWEFIDPKSKGRILKVQPQGTISANGGRVLENYARSGLGILWCPLDMVEEDISSGRLTRILQQWDMEYDGYHLYYPNRRQNSPLFKALVEELRLVK
ncbi:LysR family transcriptional regulator [Basfia succiniciproducens]|uniref:Transcriptional regulator, LysR family n=1 Tax=Basfia succiniciproducens TaxID=653940 RepID=A0A1G5E2H6_9PAST|nr:LysR family transcriptional regulator [Basfia succiniciproducens]QIM68706.1 LysR family transcriptional regulator [Basfia succiniciproducens]SCY20950.1 transcriptional regulator, LysR family [Basfia succiniciproducens]